MVGKIEYENTFKNMVSAGCLPVIKNIIAEYEARDKKDRYLYSTMVDIGQVVDSYYKFLQTGNNVEMTDDYIRVAKCVDKLRKHFALGVITDPVGGVQALEITVSEICNRKV